MEEGLIKYETAKLAEQKNFQLNYVGKYVVNPTQSLLQKWLREVHNIDVLIHMNMNHEYSAHIWKNKISINKDKDIENFIVPNGTNYEEILEQGLFEGLKLIS